MKKFLSAGFLLSTLSTNAYALDLTPREIPAAHDGPPVKRYFFQDRDKRVVFRVDTNMSVSGENNMAMFQFRDLPGAEMKLIPSPRHPDLPFDEKGLDDYRAVARGLVPANATQVEFIEERAEAIPINGWTSYEFVFIYNRAGSPCRHSITFLNYTDKQQILVQVSAHGEDFDKAYARGYHVLNSLSEMQSAGADGPT